LALAVSACGGPDRTSDVDQTSSPLVEAPGVTAGSLEVSGVAAPDCALSLGDLMLSVDVNLVLETATGSLVLVGGAVPTTSYVVDPTLNDDLVAQGATYGQIDRVFTGNEPVALGSSEEIPASALVPGGSDGLVLGATVLPATVDLIVAHVEYGVRSYRVFEITFEGPPPGQS
jgi:hypothetical protein